MTDELRNQVSVITERPVFTGPGSFAAAVGWGTVAGIAPFVFRILASLGSGFGATDFLAATFILFIFVGFLTLAGMVAIGLPATVILRAVGLEYAALYACIGGLAGFLVMAAIFEVPLNSSGHAMSAFGALAGTACAWRWGMWREQEARACREQEQDCRSNKRSNPIHDLTH